MSRVLNSTAPCRPELRERVSAAVRALEFRRTRWRRACAAGHSNTVALLVGDIAQRHFAELTMHVQAAVEATGRELMLVNLGHSATRLDDFLARAPSMRLRGVAIALSDTVPRSIAPLFAELQRSASPRVDRAEPHALRRAVDRARGARGGAALGRAPPRQGHGRIAYVGRIKGSAIGAERFRGYRAALSGAGAFDPALVFDLKFRYAAGHEAVLQRAWTRGSAFTAMQAGSDEIAMGALAALRDLGCACRDDVAIIGFGDVEMGAYLRPALTTLSSHPALAAQRTCASSSKDDGATGSDRCRARRARSWSGDRHESIACAASASVVMSAARAAAACRTPLSFPRARRCASSCAAATAIEKLRFDLDGEGRGEILYRLVGGGWTFHFFLVSQQAAGGAEDRPQLRAELGRDGRAVPGRMDRRSARRICGARCPSSARATPTTTR